MQNHLFFDPDQSSTSQISFHSEDIDPHFDKHLEIPSAFPISEEIQSDVASQFIESLMICNDVDLETELNKAKAAPEGIFKVLSVSFYDKSISSRPRPNNYSPLPMDQNEKMLTTRPSLGAAKGIDTKTTPPVSPMTRTISWSNVRLPSSEIAKTNSKQKIKLFSIREKPVKPDLSPQCNSKKVSLGVSSPGGRMSPCVGKNIVGKEERVQQGAMSPRKGSLAGYTSNGNMRLNTLDEKHSSLTKTYSPKAAAVGLNVKPKISEGGNQVFSGMFFKGFDVKGVGSQKLKTQKSATIKQFSLKKGSNIDELNRASPGPTGYTFDRNRLEYKLDIQRSSVSDVNCTPNLADLQGKISRNNTQKAQRTSPSPNHYSNNLLKVDLTKGYSYSKSHSRNATRKEGVPEPGSPKLLLSKKLRINLEENEKKIPVRNLVEQAQTTKNKSPKEKFINWAVLKHRESTPHCSGNEVMEGNKSNVKYQNKYQGKDGGNTPEPQKQRSNTLGFRCKTFEI